MYQIFLRMYQILGCSKSAKVCSDLGNDLQSLPMGPQRIICTMGI